MTGQITVRVVGTKGSAPRDAGAQMAVSMQTFNGTIGGGSLEWEALAQARDMLSTGRDYMRQTLSLGPDMGQCCGGQVTLEFTRGVPGAEFTSPPLWIWGAGHVGRAIVGVMAPFNDRHITLIDTNMDRMPTDLPPAVAPLVAAEPVRAVRHAPAHAAHLILTYSHDIDLALCDALLRHGFGQCGLIGSATKWARFRRRLASLGHTDSQISRIDCPIGDPSLGKHPQAIAIGVAAALICWATEAPKDQGR